MKNKTFNVLALALIIGSITSCKKELKKVGMTSETSTEIHGFSAREYSEDNYLTFGNYEQFDSILHVLEELTELEKDKWESNFDNGFKSMRKICNEHNILDSIYFAPFIANGDTSLPTGEEHCPTIRSNQSMYVQITVPSVGGYILRKNVSIERFSWLVNKHGIVKINNVIYQNKKGVAKRMYPAVDSHISALISATANDGTKGITVVVGGWSPLPKINTCDPASFYSNDWWLEDQVTTFSTKGLLCIELQVDFNNPIHPDCRSFYRPQLDASIFSTRRNAVGIWVTDPAHLTYSITYLKNFNSPTINSSLSTNAGLLTSTGFGPSHTHHIEYNLVNSLDPPSTMFTLSQVVGYATRSGGASGGSATINH